VDIHTECSIYIMYNICTVYWCSKASPISAKSDCQHSKQSSSVTSIKNSVVLVNVLTGFVIVLTVKKELKTEVRTGKGL
jgi:hypothetical protein